MPTGTDKHTSAARLFALLSVRVSTQVCAILLIYFSFMYLFFYATIIIIFPIMFVRLWSACTRCWGGGKYYFLCLRCLRCADTNDLYFCVCDLCADGLVWLYLCLHCVCVFMFALCLCFLFSATRCQHALVPATSTDRHMCGAWLFVILCACACVCLCVCITVCLYLYFLFVSFIFYFVLCWLWGGGKIGVWSVCSRFWGGGKSKNKT